MRTMGIKGLTLYHLKSHLQKYRLGKQSSKEFNENSKDDTFRGIFRKNSQATMSKIHVYGFSKAQDPELEFHERIRTALVEVAVDAEMHRVRLVAPGKWMLCASFVLPEVVAFAKEDKEMRISHVVAQMRILEHQGGRRTPSRPSASAQIDHRTRPLPYPKN